MNNLKLFLFIIMILTFGCSDAEKNSKFKKVSLTECKTHKDNFQLYFESNITPLFSVPAKEITKMIDASLVNELKRYSDIFHYCDIEVITKRIVEEKPIENEQIYFSISNSLTIIAAHLGGINKHQLSDEDALDVNVKHMRIDYEKIKNELAR